MLLARISLRKVNYKATSTIWQHDATLQRVNAIIQGGLGDGKNNNGLFNALRQEERRR